MSFSKHRRANREMSGGVAAGSADQSGSRPSVDAITSDTVGPPKAQRPINISYRTHPKDQMSPAHAHARDRFAFETPDLLRCILDPKEKLDDTVPSIAAL